MSDIGPAQTYLGMLVQLISHRWGCFSCHTYRSIFQDNKHQRGQIFPRERYCMQLSKNWFSGNIKKTIYRKPAFFARKRGFLVFGRAGCLPSRSADFGKLQRTWVSMIQTENRYLESRSTTENGYDVVPFDRVRSCPIKQQMLWPWRVLVLVPQMN